MLRQAKPPLIAVVRLRKRNEWVLPKGKLDDGETPRDAAEREVNEETGHDVIVHEFLGTLVYEASGRSKIVHYWRMQADGEQVYELMTDIREVDWLPLEVALTRLSRASERAFLEQVGPVAVSATLADLSRRKAKAAQASKPATAPKPAASKPAPAPKAAPATKPAPAPVTAATKAAATKKPRSGPAAPAKPLVQPQPAASVPSPAPAPADMLLAPPVPAPIELPPAAPDMPDPVSSAPAESVPMPETPEQLPPVRAQDPATIERPEPVQSADPVEPVCGPRPADPKACEPLSAVPVEADPAPPAPPPQAPEVAGTDATESRRKSLGEMLRNWLGSVA